MLSDEQREFLMPKAYNAAIRAGAVILDLYNGTQENNVDLKSDLTPITLADLKAHTTIKDYLSQTRIPLLSEEGREMLYEERSCWDLFWLVDPLDGTKEFLKRNGEFTVSIALMVNNKPEIGIIYVPYINKIYFCDRANGSMCKEGVVADPEAEFSYNDILESAKKLPLSSEVNNPVRMGVSRSHINELTYKHIDETKKKYPDLELVVQGSSYKFCMLAEGSIDYYIRTTNTYEWDTAAGELILELAGGSTFDLETGEKFNYNKRSLLNPFFVCRNAHLK